MIDNGVYLKLSDGSQHPLNLRKSHIYIYTHTHTHTHIFMYVHMNTYYFTVILNR